MKSDRPQMLASRRVDYGTRFEEAPKTCEPHLPRVVGEETNRGPRPWCWRDRHFSKEIHYSSDIWKLRQRPKRSALHSSGRVRAFIYADQALERTGIWDPAPPYTGLDQCTPGRDSHLVSGLRVMCTK
jgi:hypothetical protein